MRMRQHEQDKSNTECIWETKYHSRRKINIVIGSWRGMVTRLLKNKDEIKREATSIKIDPQLWKQAKIEAIRNDMELSELVAEAIEKWIEDDAHNRVKNEKK